MNSKNRKVMWNNVKAKRVHSLQKAGRTSKEIHLETGVKPNQQKSMGLLGERLISLEV